MGAIRPTNFPRQTNCYGQVGGDHFQFVDRPDDANGLTGVRGSEGWGSCARWHPSGTSREAMKKRWSPSRTSVTIMCITTQRRNQPHAG
jgi:hypothetical protein